MRYFLRLSGPLCKRTAIAVGRWTHFYDPDLKHWRTVTDSPADPQSLCRNRSDALIPLSRQEWRHIVRRRWWLVILEDAIGLRPISRLLERFERPPKPQPGDVQWTDIYARDPRDDEFIPSK